MVIKMPKYSKGFERDWKFYNDNKDRYNFCGEEIDIAVWSPTGVDAKYAFLKYDSKKEIFPTKEPELLNSILLCKASVNLHIKMYAEDLERGTFSLIDLEEIRTETRAPAWFMQAVWNQAKAISKRSNKEASFPTDLILIREKDPTWEDFVDVDRLITI